MAPPIPLKRRLEAFPRPLQDNNMRLHTGSNIVKTSKQRRFRYKWATSCSCLRCSSSALLFASIHKPIYDRGNQKITCSNTHHYPRQYSRYWRVVPQADNFTPPVNKSWKGGQEQKSRGSFRRKRPCPANESKE